MLSRSRRKHPYIGITTCESEKDDKREAHRRYRHAVRQRLRADGAPGELEAAETLPHWRTFSDPWTWGKDGKWLIPPTHPRAAQLMRK